MALSDRDKRVGWAAVVLLCGIMAVIVAVAVWLVGPPNWSASLEAALWVVLLVAFGPALGRWAGVSIRRTFLLAFGSFVAAFSVEALRSGLPLQRWEGLVGLLATSLIEALGLLVILAVLSVMGGPGLPGRRAPAGTGGDEKTPEAARPR